MDEQEIMSNHGEHKESYGAAPEINPYEANYTPIRETIDEPIREKIDIPVKESKKKKEKSDSAIKKIGVMFVGGITFGLAAALVFVCVIKASGLDKSLAALSEMNKMAAADAATAQRPEEPLVGTEEIIDNPDENDAPESMVQSNEKIYSVSEIATGCMPSIVSITNKSVEEVRSMFGTRQYESTSAGSGIIIGKNDDELLIATNNHVVVNASELSVCFGDDEAKVVAAKIKGTDEANDLAIIAVDMSDLSGEIKKSIAIAKIGKSNDIQIGDPVVAIGNALGYGQSVTTGIVSAKDREVTIEGRTAKLIQTDAAINPGNSGGALLNMKGELIGINSSKFASSVVEGMGYAIPIDTAEPILEDLMNRETRDVVDADKQGYLGISCQNVSADIAEMYKIPKGVYVLDVARDGAAESAGIQKGDILTTFDGMTISDYDDLKNTLQYYKAGETIDVTIYRGLENGGYKEMVISVTLCEGVEEEVQDNPYSDIYDAYGDDDDYGYGRDGYDGYSPEEFFDNFFGDFFGY